MTILAKREYLLRNYCDDDAMKIGEFSGTKNALREAQNDFTGSEMIFGNEKYDSGIAKSVIGSIIIILGSVN